jgi:hypothetical protein
MSFKRRDVPQATRSETEHRILFEAFGVPVSVEVASVELLDRVRSILPPGARACESAPDDHRFRLQMKDGVFYRVSTPDESPPGSSDLDVELAILDAELRAFIALHAPDHIFVHAGVAAREGTAILIPGPSFSGKTTLVSEFVRAGATYYSDDLAALDSGGRVHPYPKPLSIRTNGLDQTDHDVSAFGGTVGADPVPVGLVIFSQYRPGALWQPERLSTGDAVLGLLSNAVPVQDRPGESLTAVRKAADGAIALEGERGEAAEVVEQLLDALPA